MLLCRRRWSADKVFNLLKNRCTMISGKYFLSGFQNFSKRFSVQLWVVDSVTQPSQAFWKAFNLLHVTNNDVWKQNGKHNIIEAHPSFKIAWYWPICGSTIVICVTIPMNSRVWFWTELVTIHSPFLSRIIASFQTPQLQIFHICIYCIIYIVYLIYIIFIIGQ